MESKKDKKPKKAKSYKQKQVLEKTDFKTKLKNFGNKLGQLETRNFWYSHLPWPKFIRKPKIRFVAPRIDRTIPMPSRNIMFVIALFLVGFSIAGGAYNLINNVYGGIVIGYDTSTTPPTAIFFLSGIHDQFMLEGMIAFALIVCGFLGFLFIHQSTKHFYRPKHSYMLFAVGIALLIFAFFSLQMIVVQGKDINMYGPNF